MAEELDLARLSFSDGEELKEVGTSGLVQNSSHPRVRGLSNLSKPLAVHHRPDHRAGPSQSPSWPQIGRFRDESRRSTKPKVTGSNPVGRAKKPLLHPGFLACA